MISSRVNRHLGGMRVLLSDWIYKRIKSCATYVSYYETKNGSCQEPFEIPPGQRADCFLVLFEQNDLPHRANPSVTAVSAAASNSVLA